MVRKRNDLFAELNRRGLTGIAVEVGVAEGDFSFYMADCCPKLTVYQVDPWSALSKEEYNDYNNTDQIEQNRRYDLVVGRAVKYANRVRQIRDFSINAANQFQDNSLDFVYLDANHKYDFIKQDIDLWWPKVRRNGIFAGHDYLDGIISSGEYGVKTAVDEFASRNNLKTNITLEKDYPTWWIVK